MESASFDRKQVLIVDDEPSILKLLNFILSKQYDIHASESGYKAHLWLEDGNFPDIIILDLHMPHFDGSSFLKSIKISGYYRDIPVIILSAADNLDSIVANFPFRVEAFFPKPFNPESLKSKMAEILESTSNPINK
ncbi:putative two-component system response regulator [Pedobacter sp. BAL39]|uniref:response regulator n=1 Tax=Pedobacter sp. BAL39 TaxID=391596 RepID=UPI00015594B4|nr:response regulator [Pedobacter sp. BAL39]EDM38226.1 putative two-component system response regulator [Pedobacter sp. BAL39]